MYVYLQATSTTNTGYSYTSETLLLSLSLLNPVQVCSLLSASYYLHGEVMWSLASVSRIMQKDFRQTL